MPKIRDKLFVPSVFVNCEYISVRDDSRDGGVEQARFSILIRISAHLLTRFNDCILSDNGSVRTVRIKLWLSRFPNFLRGLTQNGAHVFVQRSF